MYEKKIKAVLAGNPNCGKTTVFNLLTGSSLRVGNWAGVTVEKKEGSFRFGNLRCILTDLPGTYSLEPLSSDEKVTAEHISKKDYDVIINIIDATHIENSLYLTVSLLKIGKPVIVLLNMSDIAQRNGININAEMLSKLLMCPVIPFSARKRIGVNDLMISLKDFRQTEFGFFSYFTDKRSVSDFIKKIISECVIVKRQRKSLSDKIDTFLLSKLCGIPFLLIITGLMFFLCFGKPTAVLSKLISDFFGTFLHEKTYSAMISAGISPIISDMICNGIISGIGSVISFLPQLLVLFVTTSVLEDSGYMSRAAVITDMPLSKFGLSGQSFISLALGFGCSTTAVMSARVLPDSATRRITALCVPFITCTAKLPFLMYIADYSFGAYAMPVVLFMYLIGILTALLSAKLMSILGNDRYSLDGVTELPEYRLPSLRSTVKNVIGRLRDFFIKAGTVLFFASILIWFLSSFDMSFNYCEGNVNSLISVIGKRTSYLFSPLGFGDGLISSALLTGIISKESVLSSLTVMLQKGIGTLSFLTVPSALSLMVFYTLYTPCIAALMAIKKECGKFRYLLFSALLQFAVAWTVSFIVYLFALSFFR